MSRGEFDHDQFARVLAYYRECLRYDADRSVVLRQSDEGVRFLTLKFSSEWAMSGKRRRAASLNGPNAGFGSNLQQSSQSVELTYGYPLLARRSGYRGLDLIPVFLQPVSHEFDVNRLTVTLNHDRPEVNDAFCSAIGIRSSEDKKQLYDHLGLTGDEERQLKRIGRLSALSVGVARICPMSEYLNPESIPQGPKITNIKSERDVESASPKYHPTLELYTRT